MTSLYNTLQIVLCTSVYIIAIEMIKAREFSNRTAHILRSLVFAKCCAFVSNFKILGGISAVNAAVVITSYTINNVASPVVSGANQKGVH